MSRPIKFRLWTGRTMLYLDDFTMQGNGWGSHWLVCSATLSLSQPSRNARGEYQEDPELGDTDTWLEYTGLKDKNGVEIYEGDILKRPSPDKRMKDHVWAVEYEELTDNYWGSPIGAGFYIEDCTEQEVIGNIYENPELLK